MVIRYLTGFVWRSFYRVSDMNEPLDEDDDLGYVQVGGDDDHGYVQFDPFQ